MGQILPDRMFYIIFIFASLITFCYFSELLACVSQLALVSIDIDIDPVLLILDLRMKYTVEVLPLHMYIMFVIM